ncbi:MAG: hypothetical protein FWB71_05695 [Defluviitaleaceae bacterium]|nr:hypothetical protein [Defluviitaleaceae bacterium]
MKITNIFGGILLVSLIFLVGCTPVADYVPENTEPAGTPPPPTTPIVTHPPPTEMATTPAATPAPPPTAPPEARVVLHENSPVSSSWARTGEHIFIAYYGGLFRLPLDDIAGGELVQMPGYGDFVIAGMDERYLFVARESGDWEERRFDTYRLCFASLAAELVDSGVYYGAPVFHAGAGMLIFAHNVDNLSVRLEAMDVATKARRVIYEFESYNFFSFNTDWWRTENGDVIFINSSWGGAEQSSDFILIDANLRAEAIGNSQIQHYLGHRYNHALEINGIRFATMAAPELDPQAAQYLKAVLLDDNGEIAKILGHGWDGHNTAFGVRQFLDLNMVAVVQFSFWTTDWLILAVYCIDTGGLINFETFGE